MSYEETLAAREKVLDALRKAGVSADLRQKIENCYDGIARGGKTMLSTQYLLYYLSKAEKERSAVAALGSLVEAPDAGSPPEPHEG